MTSSSQTRAEVNVEVSRITTEPGPAKTLLRITANPTPSTMAVDVGVTFRDDPVIKVNGKTIRKRGARSAKKGRCKHTHHSDTRQDSSTSDFESISLSDYAHNALATPPGSKRPSLAASSLLPTSDRKRRCRESSSLSTPATMTSTTVSSPACMTDGSEGDFAYVDKPFNPQAQDTTRGLACPLHARHPMRYPDCGALRHDAAGAVCEHIQKQHLRPDYYCARCAKTFKSSAEQRKHITARTCQLVSPLVVEGVHPDRIAALGEWQPAERDGIEEQWRQIWEILFQDGKGGQVDCWAA